MQVVWMAEARKMDAIPRPSALKAELNTVAGIEPDELHFPTKMLAMQVNAPAIQGTSADRSDMSGCDV